MVNKKLELTVLKFKNFKFHLSFGVLTGYCRKIKIEITIFFLNS